MDVAQAQKLLKNLDIIMKFECLTVGTILLILGSIVLSYVTLYKRMWTRYLVIIPVFTVIWGITGIIIGFNTTNSIFKDTSVFLRLNMMIHLYSISIVHWAFVFRYYKTSRMLPKIFHEIMIDDFIEGGKLYR